MEELLGTPGHTLPAKIRMNGPCNLFLHFAPQAPKLTLDRVMIEWESKALDQRCDFVFVFVCKNLTIVFVNAE